MAYDFTRRHFFFGSLLAGAIPSGGFRSQYSGFAPEALKRAARYDIREGRYGIRFHSASFLLRLAARRSHPERRVPISIFRFRSRSAEARREVRYPRGPLWHTISLGVISSSARCSPEPSRAAD